MLRWQLLAVLALLAVPASAGSRYPPGWQEAGLGGPTLFALSWTESYRVSMRLAGGALRLGEDRAVPVVVELQGIVERDVPRAALQRERGAMQAWVQVLDPQGPRAFAATLALDAWREAYASAGTEGWRFTAAEGELRLDGSTSGARVRDGYDGHAVSAGGAMGAMRLVLLGEAVEERA
jgi:hypothetical protein